MKKENAMYLACAVDTDGSIFFSRHWNRNRTGYIYQPKVVISNNSKEFLTHCQNLIGFGKIYAYNSKHFRLCIQGHTKIVKFLSEIEKFLLIKRNKALLLLEFCRSRINRNKWKAKYSEKELEIIELLRS